MVLVMVRQEGGPHEKRPKTLKVGWKTALEIQKKTALEIQRTLSENWHSDGQKKVQLTLSQGKKKKGDGVEDKDDDDVVRTSTSRERVTVTLSAEELFLCTQYI
jgi:hypothetical protein